MSVHLDSKNFYLLILAGISLVCSSVFFSLLNDPEGPNLLIVTLLAITLYFLSLIISQFLPFANQKKLLFAILIQVAIITGLYFVLK